MTIPKCFVAAFDGSSSSKKPFAPIVLCAPSLVGDFRDSTSGKFNRTSCSVN